MNRFPVIKAMGNIGKAFVAGKNLQDPSRYYNWYHVPHTMGYYNGNHVLFSHSSVNRHLGGSFLSYYKQYCYEHWVHVSFGLVFLIFFFNTLRVEMWGHMIVLFLVSKKPP